METGPYSEYNSGYNAGWSQAQDCREKTNGLRVALDFDEAQLDSMIAKAERLKSILTGCNELIKEMLNPPPQEMTFDDPPPQEMILDEFTKQISNYIVETANDAKNAKKA